MTSPLLIDPKTTALVVIDLQRGILARETSPYSAPHVLERAVALLAAARKARATVVLVNVGFSPDEKDRLATPADAPNPPGKVPDGYSDLDPALGPEAGDLLITKRQWGAFYGTMLDLQLRRRGIRTMILSGIATNFGVESTARDAWERGYELVFAEDAMAGLSSGAHHFAITTIFPRLGRIRSTDQILQAFGG